MIIFLDFDGVLCTGRQAIATNERGVISGLDPIALMFLDRMCREFECKTVISSTWRISHNRQSFQALFASAGCIALKNSLAYYNQDISSWMTPITGGARGEEIEAWLLKYSPDAEYIIIDDDSDLLEYQRKRHIHTDSHDGMLMKHYLKAEELISTYHSKEQANQ